jgi:hypothetical protein
LAVGESAGETAPRGARLTRAGAGTATGGVRRVSAGSAAGGPAAVEMLLAGDGTPRPEAAPLLEAAASALAAGGRGELVEGERLRARGHPPELVSAAFAQAELRLRAAAKFSRAAGMLFTRDGLEQASSEAAARHRASRFDGLVRIADLCTGIGGDLLALAAGPAGEPGAARGRVVLAVDRDATHLRLARHNACVYTPDAAVEPLCADVREVDLRGVDGVFVDPARRSAPRAGPAPRRFAPGVGEPPLAWCFAVEGAVAAVAVKAAPGLDTGLVPAGWEIEFVAEGRALKEAVLFSPALAAARRRATVLTAAAGAAETASLVGDPDSDPDVDGDGDGDREVGEPDAYLYDPNPAVTRAGLVGELGRRLGAWQVDPRIAFLTCGELRRTPFARALRVQASLPFDVRRLRELLRARGAGSVELRRRGLAGDVDALRRRLAPHRSDLTPGGPAMTVVMTRVHDRPWAFVCTPAGTSGEVGA